MDTLGEVFRELDYNILIKLESGWCEWVIRAIVVVAMVSHFQDVIYVYIVVSLLFKQIKTDLIKLPYNLLHYCK